MIIIFLNIFILVFLISFFISLFFDIHIFYYLIFQINLLISFLFLIEMVIKKPSSYNRTIWTILLIIPFGWVFYYNFGSFLRNYNKEESFLNLKNNIKNLKKNKNETQIENIEIFNEGLDYFKEIIKQINKSKKTIYFHFYIVKNDFVAKEIQTALIKALKRNVKVFMVIDYLGIEKESKKQIINPLIDKGAIVSYYNPIRPFIINDAINYRNHTKYLIIDKKMLFGGGSNIGAEYLNASNDYYDFKDINFKISGNIINHFLIYFEYAFNSYSKNKISVEKNENKEKNNNTKVIFSLPFVNPNELFNNYIKIIKKAKKEIIIETPYLSINNNFFKELINAKNRGVDVKIILPDKDDGKKFAYDVLLNNANKLNKKGINVLFLKNKFLHSKIILIDNELIGIGTTNIDNRSFYLNEEYMIFYRNVKLTKEYKNSILKDKKKYATIESKKINIFKIIRYKFYSLFYYYF